MKKSILIIISCIVCVIAFQAFSVSNEPKYTNLKILPSDISKHDLDSVMHHFSQSLGVKCNFCHVWNQEQNKMDFVTDEKPEKNVARRMMLMAIDINKNYFASTEMEHGMGMDHDMDKEHQAMMHKDNMSRREMKREKKKGEMNMQHDMKSMNMDSTHATKNVKYMLMEVNCYTCHRGSEHPDSKLPPPPPRPAPPSEPAAPAQNN